MVAGLLCLIPVVPIVALLVCGAVAWRSSAGVRWRVAWLVLTALAMTLQAALLLVVISPAQ